MSATNPEQKQNLPLVLHRERLNKGLSLRDLGKLVGVHRSTISYWEYGIKEPRDKNKIKLVAIFGMKIEDLLAVDNSN